MKVVTVQSLGACKIVAATDMVSHATHKLYAAIAARIQKQFLQSVLTLMILVSLSIIDSLEIFDEFRAENYIDGPAYSSCQPQGM